MSPQEKKPNQPQQNGSRHAVVELVWRTMHASWGRAFERQWQPPSGLEGQAVSEFIERMKEHWTRELQNVNQNDLNYALANLPDQPCTLPEFKSICRRAPPLRGSEASPNLEVSPNPAVVAAAIRAFHNGKKTLGDPLQVHRDHMTQEISGKKLTMRQREFWRIALRAEIRQRYSIDSRSPSFSIEQLRKAMNHD